MSPAFWVFAAEAQHFCGDVVNDFIPHSEHSTWLFIWVKRRHTSLHFLLNLKHLPAALNHGCINGELDTVLLHSAHPSTYSKKQSSGFQIPAIKMTWICSVCLHIFGTLELQLPPNKLGGFQLTPCTPEWVKKNILQRNYFPNGIGPSESIFC